MVENPISTPNDAEVKILGGLLLHPESLAQVIDVLHPEDFSQERHRVIYTAVLSLYQQNGPINAQTVCEVLKQQGNLERVGGSEYLASFIQSIEEQEIRELAASLRRHAAARRLLSAGERIQHLARTEPDETIAFEKAMQILTEMRQIPVTFASPLAELLVESKKIVNQRHTQRDEWSGIPTGFENLDKLTDGLQPSDLIIVAAPPSTGKTSFALSIALTAALDVECPVGIFSPQTNHQRLAQRLLNMQANTDFSCMRTGRLEAWEREDVAAVAEELMKRAVIWIDDTPDLSTEQLRQRARFLVEHKHVGLIIVDEIDLMRATVNGRRIESRLLEVEEISRTLKVIARELNVPVLAVAQLPRIMERPPVEISRSMQPGMFGYDPKLKQVVVFPPPVRSRFTEPRLGVLEQNADLMLVLYHDEKDNTESEFDAVVTIIVAKQRNGPLTNIKVHFQKKQGRFCDDLLAPQEEQLDEHPS